MKKRFSEEQIISILGEDEAGVPPVALPPACYLRHYFLYLA